MTKVEHLKRIDSAAADCDKVQRILLEVNVSGEENRSGFTPQEVYDALVTSTSFENIKVCGLCK